MADAQVPLGQITLTTALSTVEFTNLPSVYRDLILVVTLRNSTTGAWPGLRFNGDSGGNYYRNGVRGGGTSTTAYAVTGETAGFCDGPTAEEAIRINLMDYSTTDKIKVWLTRADSVTDNAGAVVGRWSSTAAINRVTLTSTTAETYGIGSTFSLYGVLA